MEIDKRLLALIGACALLLFIGGYVVSPNCADCFRTHGWPTCYYREGGFAGSGAINWRGACGDLIDAITGAVIIWAIWMAVLPRTQRIEEKTVRRPTWGWVRLFYSAVLMVSLIGSAWQEIHGTTDPRFAPDNQTQLAGMMFANVIFLALSGWLALSGMRMIRYTGEQTPR